MQLGFIGTGTITAAIVEGLFQSSNGIDAVHLSPRNAEISARLAHIDPRIRVASSNQEVLDLANVVVLAVRPQIAESVLAPLQFLGHHHVISVIATIQTNTVRQWVGPVERITRAIPLPFVATCDGMTAVYPPDPVADELFNSIGATIEAESESELDLFLSASALMGPYFQLLSECNRWLIEKGMSEGRARAYLDALFASLSRTASAKSDSSFSNLKDEFSTVGGLNEQAARVLKEKDAVNAFGSALESVHQRIVSAAQKSPSAS